ncbi:unnamed protein product [Brugia timori]|uniref:P6 n=1 Tax=Brugia timori TaxID=42155 RepID=A0A0R3QEQ5_9BILA|nr:unnamed protein product [Brugia timori]
MDGYLCLIILSTLVIVCLFLFFVYYIRTLVISGICYNRIFLLISDSLFVYYDFRDIN